MQGNQMRKNTARTVIDNNINNVSSIRVLLLKRKG